MSETAKRIVTEAKDRRIGTPAESLVVAALIEIADALREQNITLALINGHLESMDTEGIAKREI